METNLIENFSSDNRCKGLILGELLSSLLVIFFSFVVGIIIFFDANIPSYYKMLPVLPISFAIINIIFISNYEGIKDNTVYLLVVFLYLVRNVITPLFMFLGNYSSYITTINSENAAKGICLMIYETVIVFTVLFYSKKKCNTNSQTCVNKVLLKNKGFFKIIIILMFLFCIYAYFRVPELQTHYNSIFNISKVAHSKITSIPIGNINRMLFTLFNVFFNIIQLFISVFLITKFKKVFKNKIIALLLSYSIVSLQLLFMTGENGYTFILLFILIKFIIEMYPQYAKMSILILVTSTIIIFFTLLYAKVGYRLNEYTFFDSISNLTQAYFPGVANNASVFNIVDMTKLKTLFFDLYYMIPFRESLFGIQGDRLVILYTNQNFGQGQIIPCIGQAYHYLGFWLAPLIPGLLIGLAVKVQNKAKIKNIYIRISNELLYVFLAATPIMYNVTILGSRFFGTILPMILLANLSSNRIDESETCDY